MTQLNLFDTEHMPNDKATELPNITFLDNRVWSKDIEARWYELRSQRRNADARAIATEFVLD